MNIYAKAIVSNSDIMKNYKTCRDKAEINGKLFILKNNQPDAVLFSIKEYERFSALIECIESYSESDMAKVLAPLLAECPRMIHHFSNLTVDLDDQQK